MPTRLFRRPFAGISTTSARSAVSGTSCVTCCASPVPRRACWVQLGPQGSRWSAFERPWLVPDAMRTRYFTGRQQLLARLRAQLLERHRAALSGLGGVGKTQTAIEYAVRHRAEYPDGVFWVNAETIGGLTRGLRRRLLRRCSCLPRNRAIRISSSRRRWHGWTQTTTGCSFSTTLTTAARYGRSCLRAAKATC